MRYLDERSDYEQWKKVFEKNVAIFFQKACPGGYSCFVNANEVECRSRDGFIPYTNGGFTAFADIPTGQEYISELSLEMSQKTRRMLCDHETNSWLYDLENFSDGEFAQKYSWFSADSSLREKIMREANAFMSALENNGREEEFHDYQAEHSDLARITYGMLWQPDREKEKDENSCYLFVSVNFDYPYFRSNSEIRRALGAPNAMDSDILVAEMSGPLPDSAENFSKMLEMFNEKMGITPDVPEMNDKNICSLC